SRSELNDFLKHRRHRARNIRRNHFMNSGMRFLEQSAVVRGDAANHVWIDADAVIREHSESGDVLEQPHIRSAQREWQIRWQRSRNAKSFGFINNGADADLFCELYGRHIARTGQCPAQRDGPFEFLIIIAWRIRLPAADRREWRVQNGIERRKTFFERVSINVDLK